MSQKGISGNKLDVNDALRRSFFEKFHGKNRQILEKKTRNFIEQIFFFYNLERINRRDLKSSPNTHVSDWITKLPSIEGASAM